MKVTVLFFAHLREAAGSDRWAVDLPVGAKIESLLEALEDRRPGLRARLDSLPVVVDGEISDRGRSLFEGAEVAWIPPVAGGSEGAVVEARLTRSPIDGDALTRAVSHPGCGAVVLFLGVVRDREGEREVERLEYEAYERLAEERLSDIARTALRRWPEARIGIVHRLGSLELGETSVAVAVAAAHRAEAFECCRAIMESVKTSVPIWKKSFGLDGSKWVEGSAYDPGAGGIV